MKTQLSTILLVLFATMAQAQHKVSGKIVDSQGEAIVGAIVQEENGTHGTVTDLNGNYELTTSSADAALLFSYSGYDTQRIPVAQKQTLDVTMYATSDSNKTLYVVDGVPTTKKAVDQLPPDQIKNMNVMRGVENVVLITTQANKSENVVVVKSPKQKQTQSTLIKIDKQTNQVTIDEEHRGSTYRTNKTSSYTLMGDPLFIVKKANGKIKSVKSVDDIRPENIRAVSVYKDDKSREQFKQYGDTSNGVIYIELKE